MTETIREKCVLRLIWLLQQISVIPGLKVERNRDAGVTEFPTVNVIDGDHDTDSSSLGFEEHVMECDLEIYASAKTDDVLQASFDQVFGAISKAAASDTSLNGNAVDVKQLGLKNVQTLTGAEGMQPARCGVLVLEITFSTKYGDPYTVGP
jgi:predicted TIM-barrel enzyme